MWQYLNEGDGLGDFAEDFGQKCKWSYLNNILFVNDPRRWAFQKKNKKRDQRSPKVAERKHYEA